MTRRTHISLLAAAVASGAPVMGKDNETMRELLEASEKDKKGIMLWVKGQTIPGIVVKTAGDFIEMRSREYSRIVVRVDSIDAVAMA
jgi:hypothetical protein